MRSLFFPITVFAFAAPLAGLEPLPEEPAALLAHLASPDCGEELRRDIETRRAGLEKNDDDLSEILAFLKASLPGSGASERERIRAHASIHRILASIDADEPVNELPPLNIAFRNVVWGSLFGHGIPIVPEKLRDHPSGEAAAEESLFLHDPADDSYLDTSELAGLSPREIANLDIGPGHPAWLARAELERSRGSRPDRVESSIQQGLVGRLVEKERPGASRYRLDTARRVLFLDKIEKSATSPKVDAEDAYGVEWKLKWGDEPAVEPVASRLYLLAGGRDTDLVFANPSGRAGVTLVLEKESKEDDEDERHAATVDELKAVLDEFYGFDLEPYIYESGTITAGNVGGVLALLPDGGEKKYRPENLIGREWVTFRESGSELKADELIHRLDGAAAEDPITAHDRVFRSVYLFDLWIQNADVKQDNNKTYFRRSRDGDAVVALSEGHHDLGLSLGGLWSSGEVNRFRTGDRFASEGANKLRFRGPLLFKPKVWGAATWADGKWMARHIASIGVDDIETAVRHSLWPDFVQALLVSKLAERRDAIAELFGEADRLDRFAPPSPEIAFVIDTPDAIRALEQRYELPRGAIDDAIAVTGLPPGGRDLVVSGGAVTSCKVSPLVHALTKHRYPSGIAERYRRQSDKPPVCE